MKKLIAVILIFVMLLGSLSTIVANVQLAVDDLNIDDVHFVIGENVVTGDAVISPTMSISWTDPSAWANDIDIHSPSEYRVTVDNRTFNTENEIVVFEGSEEFTDHAIDLHNEMNLETGSFYEIKVHPYHYHEETNGDSTTKSEAPTVEAPVSALAVTDLKVDFESDEESIQVVWDDLGFPDFEYRIIYAVGDYTTRSKQELINNAVGQVTGITMDSDDVEAFYDPSEQRNKLSYSLTQGVYPGQVYSIIVEPMTDYYNGSIIVRNRNYPFINTVSTNVELTLVEEGEYLRLQWEIPSSFKVGQDQDEYGLVEATLMQYQDGYGSTIAIFDDTAASIGYYRIQKPIWETDFQITLTYKAVDDTTKPAIHPESNLLTYIPTEYLIQPTKPYVPNVLNEDILEDIKTLDSVDQMRDVLRDKYLVSGYSYTDPIDNIFDADVTFHTDDAISGINFVWDAFRRIDVDATSSNYGTYITDTNIYYDVWVTDQLETLGYATPVLDEVRYSSTTDDHVIVTTKSDGEQEIVGYKGSLTFYYDTETKEMKEISPGHLYYIKVHAKKITSQGTLTSEPTITSIYYSYDGASFEPPTIAKPPLHVKEDQTTTESVTISWKESWHEIISAQASYPDLLANWQHEVWVDKDSGEVYKELHDNSEQFMIYEGETEIERFKDYLDVNFNQTPTIISRQVNLGLDDFGSSDVRYSFYRQPYDYVLNKIEERQLVDAEYSFEEYYSELLEGDKDGSASILWRDIDPLEDDDNPGYIEYTESGMFANTSYLFILMPYRELADETILYAHFPTPLIVSTNPEDSVVIPDPTVPTLYITDPTDMSLTATWKYNTDFEYQIMYGVVEDIDKAEEFPIELPESTVDPNYPQDGKYYELIVDDLFPLTTYYFWIKAKQVSNSKESLWSNPALGTTTDIDSPVPTRGMGLPPLSRTELYDYEQSVSEDYIMVEWIKDLDDVETDDEDKKVVKSFSYIVEVADNPKFIDPIYIESSGGTNDIVPSTVEILEKNMIKINDLVANRYYYIRALTRVTVTGELQGQVITKDAISYSDPLRIITLSTGHEYDGNLDPALSILPAEDFELIYDSKDDLLVFRFRDESDDEDGAADNNVDQRLITELIASSAHEYEIDVDGYKGKDVDKRRIIIPYSIIEAFDTYQIDMVILADDMTLDLPADAVIDAVKDQVDAYGVAPSVVIDIEELDPKHLIALLPQDNLTSMTTPQKLGVEVRSRRKTDTIGYTDENMTIGLRTSSRYEIYGKETELYVQNARARWSTVDTTYDKPAGMVKFDTSDIGTYGLYILDKPTVVDGNVDPAHWSEIYRRDVFNQIAVSGLENYNPNANVTEKSVIQAVYGSAMSDTSIDLSESMPLSDMTTLQRAGLKDNGNQEGATISREECIAMFTRAYEIRNEEIIPLEADIYNQLANSRQVSDAYVAEVAKAYKAGLISDTSALRSKEAMTYGEFFALWSRVLE